MIDLINLLNLVLCWMPPTHQTKEGCNGSLGAIKPTSKSVFSKETIAAIVWTVYPQVMFFVAQGDMTGATPALT